jgi:undecaprenyl diphosphate synthase
MDELKLNIDKSLLPKHVAVIMDGNGRWAKSKGMPRVFGHRNGVNAVREICEAAAEIGIEHLTLYAFSTENWNRPAIEVNALMSLLVETIKAEVKTLNDNNIKLNTIGDISHLPEKSKNALEKAINDTSNNNRMTLHLALNYSARWEITQATKTIAEKVKNNIIQPEDITQEVFANHLNTHNIPDPELLIRTSGEYRISNYLLWQIAYAELYFTPVFWPDFRKANLYEALIDFQGRERRFGKISEQVNPANT